MAQQFRDSYVKVFLNTAHNQDIEQRIRFAKYYSSVSSEKEDWTKYLSDLTELRNTKKVEIDSLEQAWQKLSDQPRADANEVNKARRHLDWAYSEVGYAAPNRRAISNPRCLSLDSISLERRPVAQKILDAFAAAGFGQFQQVAALANAIAESGLDPNVHLSVAEDSWGLFLLNTQRGFGTGHSAEELRNPDVNIGIMVKEAQKNSAFAAATSLDAAVEIFVRQIERPKNVASEGNKSRDKFAELSADQNDHRDCRCPPPIRAIRTISSSGFPNLCGRTSVDTRSVRGPCFPTKVGARNGTEHHYNQCLG